MNGHRAAKTSPSPKLQDDSSKHHARWKIEKSRGGWLQGSHSAQGLAFGHLRNWDAYSSLLGICRDPYGGLVGPLRVVIPITALRLHSCVEKEIC